MGAAPLIGANLSCLGLKWRANFRETRLANYGFAIGQWLLNDELSNN
jgi:hypothetical protein